MPALELTYTFQPSPNPIVVSTPQTPSAVDIQVTVAPPTSEPVDLAGVTITIPVGQDTEPALSPQPDLPSPSPSTVGDWGISSSGDTVTIQPSGDTGTLVGPVTFTLGGIEVGTIPSTAGAPVQITIEEVPPTGDPVIDASTYSLTKAADDAPVTLFQAMPAVLHDLAPVKLSWRCTGAGQKLAYQLRSDHGWLPRDCQNQGSCFRCADGATGIATPRVDGLTEFSLDAIDTSSGRRTVIATYTNRVMLNAPSVAEDSYRNLYLSGRIADLYWSAENAAYCWVEVDDTPIDTYAPLDTYDTGYLMTVPQATGSHSLVVSARSGINQARADHPLPDIQVTDTISDVDVGGTPWRVTFTPTGAAALVSVGDNNAVVVIDVAGGKVARTLSTGDPNGIAVSGDGTTALVCNWAYNTVTAFDTGMWQAKGKPIPTGEFPSVVQATPGPPPAPQYAVACNQDNTITVIDVPSLTVKRTIELPQQAVEAAVSPSGKLALVGTESGDLRPGTITAIDLASLAPLPNPVPVRTRVAGIAITADGNTAIVVVNDEAAGTSVLTLSLPALQPQGDPVHVGGWGGTPALIPNSNLVIVPDTVARALLVYDFRRAALAKNPLPAGQVADGVAVTRDGRRAIAANFGATTVTLL